MTKRYTSSDIDYKSIKGRKERSGREENKIRIIVINSAFLSCHCFEVSYLKDHFLFLTKRGPSFTCQLGVCVGKHQRGTLLRSLLGTCDLTSEAGWQGRKAGDALWRSGPAVHQLDELEQIITVYLVYCAPQIPFFFFFLTNWRFVATLHCQMIAFFSNKVIFHIRYVHWFFLWLLWWLRQ